MAKIVSGTMHLEVRLKEDEIRDAAKRLAEAIGKRTEIEGRLETFKAQIKADVAEQDSIIMRSTSMVSTEREWRLVPVDITYDFVMGHKVFVRKDTGEIVKTEAITDQERQAELL